MVCRMLRSNNGQTTRVNKINPATPMPIGASQKPFPFPVHSFSYSRYLSQLDIDLIELLNLVDNHLSSAMISGPKYLTKPNLEKFQVKKTAKFYKLKHLTGTLHHTMKTILRKFYELDSEKPKMPAHISHKTKTYKIVLHKKNCTR